MSENTSVSSAVLQCFKCGVISYLVFLALCCAFSFIALKNQFFSDNMLAVCLISLAFSSLLCGYISAIKLKIKGILLGVISSFFLMVCVYVTLAVASSFSFNYKAVFVLPVCLIFSAVGAIIRKNTKHRR